MLKLLGKRDRRLNALLNCNTPPTKEEQANVDAVVQALKSEFKDVTEMDYAATTLIPQNGQKIHEKIQGYKRILAPARNVPEEVWRQVFEHLVLAIPRTRQYLATKNIRLVSKMWNTAAVGCELLWCNLPMIDFSVIQAGGFPDDPLQLRILFSYMKRSRRPKHLKALPISFTFHYWSDAETPSTVEEAQEKRAGKWIALLASELGRWGEVHFRVSRTLLHSLLDQMGRHLGPFPLLSKLSIERRGMDTVDPSRCQTWIEKLDLPTSKAPMLKHVVFDSLNPWHGQRDLSFQGTQTRLALPWAQLETFVGSTQRDTMYPHLLEAGKDLQVLKHTTNRMDSLPRPLAPLPRLTKLSLCFGISMPCESITVHLGKLVLPLLKELEVYWGKVERNGVNIYDGILSLIQRSQCSLERLATEHDGLDYNLNLQKEQFQQVLYQCPSLTHLDIAYLDAAGLRVLVPNANIRKKPPLPHLRVLTLRHPRRQGTMDPIPLLKVVFGRTGPMRNPLHDPLEDVYIKHDSWDSWRNVVLELGSHQEDEDVRRLETPFDPEFYAVALSWKEDLRRDGSILPVGIGSYSLGGRDTRVLTWLGIPALLAQVGRNRRGRPIPGSPMSEYRRQAEDLLTKWKPFLLADFRSSQYRYSFEDETTSRLSFVDKSAHGKESCDLSGGENDEGGKDRDWERILGRGDTDTWASALKGAAWLWMADASQAMRSCV